VRFIKDVKKIANSTITISMILLLCIPVFVVRNLDENTSRNLDYPSANSSQTMVYQSIWDSIEQSQSDTFELNIEISGYRIIATEVNPIEYDENSQLFLSKNANDFINIELILEFGSYKFDNIPLRGNIVIDSKGNYFISYNLDDPKKGFFMDLFFRSRSIQIDLAFDGGDSQLCYEGSYNQGYQTIPPLFPQAFEPDHMIEGFTNDITSKNQQQDVFINNQKYLEKSSESNYGIRGIFDVSYPGDLPDDYWEPYTSIDIGIHRLWPTEATVKSDLQYYNKDSIQYGHGYSRDVKAYSMGTHGGPYWEVWKSVWWWQERVGYIYPNEISALWYYSYNPQTELEIDVHPWDTIIMSDSCYGYYEPPSTDPTMAKAFVDNGASAFVGAIIEIPEDSDTYMQAFWNDLCQGNYDVEHATDTLCDTYGNGWNLGDEWRIYGDEDATLP